MLPLDIDDCRMNPCFPGVSCSDLPPPSRGYKCGPCPPGMTGNGSQCEEGKSIVEWIGSSSREEETSNVFSLVPCPEATRCFPGVGHCELLESSSIRCGPCPEGFDGDGVNCEPVCRPKCGVGYRCSAPNTCSSE